MPAAHPDNGGIQVFSATQTSAQIEEALAARGFGEFESKDYTTSLTPGTEPATPPEGEQPPVDPAAPPVTPPAQTPPAAAPPATPKPPAAPGVKERLKAENKALKEQAARDREQTSREIAELRAMITRNSAPSAPAAPVETPAPVAAPATAAPSVELPKRPRIEDFLESEDPQIAYEDAVAGWIVDCREIKTRATEDQRRREESDNRARTAQQTAEQLWNGELADARREIADFDAVIRKEHFDTAGKPLAIVSSAMTHVARNIPGGAKILYWLGTHPEEANKIALQTGIADTGDARQVEKAMRIVRREFDRIEQELSTNPLTPGDEPGSELEDDEPVEPGEEIEVDPHLQRVASDPQAGRRVEQAPSRGAVDTRPPAPASPPTAPALAPKPEPIGRVGQRGVNTNRPVQALPPETIRGITPDDYRKRRAAEGSAVARG